MQYSERGSGSPSLLFNPSTSALCPSGLALALGADSEEFQLVRDVFEAVPTRQRGFEFRREAVFDFHHRRTLGADQMMVVPVVALDQEFEPRGSIPEVKPAHHAHFLEGVQISIHRGEVALETGKRGVDLAVGERVLMPAQDIEDGLSGRGDLAGVATQLVGEFVQRRLDEPVPMRVLGAGVLHDVGA